MKRQSSIMQEDYEESISLTRRIRNSKKPSRMLVRICKHLWLLVCPAKFWRTIIWVVHPIKSKQDLRVAFGRIIPKSSWPYCKKKGQLNSLKHYIMVHKFTPMLQAMKIEAAKAAVDKEWEKFEKIPAWDRAKNQKQIWRDWWSKKRKKRTSRHWWISVIWRMPNWWQSTKKSEVELYSETKLWKKIMDFTQYFPNKDHQHQKWQQQRSWISFSDCRVAMDKQQTQYQLVPK